MTAQRNPSATASGRRRWTTKPVMAKTSAITPTYAAVSEYPPT